MGRARQAAPTYAQVVTVLGDARDDVLSAFRLAGGDREHWRAEDWAHMARALTAAEDALELRQSSAARVVARRELRAVRRRLEDLVASR